MRGLQILLVLHIDILQAYTEYSCCGIAIIGILCIEAIGCNVLHSGRDRLTIMIVAKAIAIVSGCMLLDWVAV